MFNPIDIVFLQNLTQVATYKIFGMQITFFIEIGYYAWELVA